VGIKYPWMTFFKEKLIIEKKYEKFSRKMKMEYEKFSLYEKKNIKYKNTFFLYNKNTRICILVGIFK
jgi:hypothetical protein